MMDQPTRKYTGSSESINLKIETSLKAKDVLDNLDSLRVQIQPAYWSLPMENQTPGTPAIWLPAAGNQPAGVVPAMVELATPYSAKAEPISVHVTDVSHPKTGSRRIAGELMAGGLPATTPAAAIHKGTTPDQRCALTTLADLADCLEREKFGPPTLLVIGNVVDLAAELGLRPEELESTPKVS